MANSIRATVGVKDNASSELDKIRGKFDGVSKSSGFKALAQGVGMGAGIAAYQLIGDAAGAAADFIGDSVEAASDLNETLSKSKVVFGGASGEIEAFGDKAAEALGMSKQEAIAAAATFGNLFVGVGETKSKAAEMSESVVQLASDLASFNNIDPGEALEKLRSGLSGESEPLRALGVFLSEAKVKAKAMELGLGDAHGELTEGEKVLARYKIILDETKTAQGDFARTSDELANSQRTANAKLKDAQAQLGESFEPIALGVTQSQIAIVDWFNRGVEGWQMLGGVISGETERAAQHVDDASEKIKGSMDWASMATEDAAGDIGDSMGEVGEDAGKMKAHIKTATERSADYFHTMVGNIQDDVDTLQDKAFDPIEASLEAMQGHYRVTAAVEARESAKGKSAVVDANLDIIEALDDQVDKLQELKGHHKLTAKAVDQYEADVEKAYKAMGKKVPPELRKVIKELRTLQGFNGKSVKYTVHIDATTGNKRSGGPKAAGGTVAQGVAYPVGENGPEMFVPDSSGTIVPTNKLGKGGDTHYHLTVNGNITARNETELLAALRRMQSVAKPMGAW